MSVRLKFCLSVCLLNMTSLVSVFMRWPNSKPLKDRGLGWLKGFELKKEKGIKTKVRDENLWRVVKSVLGKTVCELQVGTRWRSL